MAEARIWRATEKNSNTISLPAVVKRIREELSAGQDPRARRKALDFGAVLVEIACQDIASLGDFRERTLRAHDVPLR